jgi:hypothetical protein
MMIEDLMSLMNQVKKSKAEVMLLKMNLTAQGLLLTGLAMKILK